MESVARSPRTFSIWNRDGYGYGWFMRRVGGETAFYGWGYGGQMLYVIPRRDLVIAITSDPTRPSARSGYRDYLHDYLERAPHRRFEIAELRMGGRPRRAGGARTRPRPALTAGPSPVRNRKPGIQVFFTPRVYQAGDRSRFWRTS